MHSAFSGLPGAEYSLLWKLALENLVAANDQSHFEYGHFFATLNIANAYRYVIRNPYGSEFIQALAESLNVLRAKGDALPLKVPKEYPEVARLIENPSPPVVIELKGVSRDRLMTAKGSPNIEYELESFREMQKYEGVNAPADFRIKDVTLADIVAIHDLRGWPAGELDDELWRPDERKVAAVRGAGNAVARRL